MKEYKNELKGFPQEIIDKMVERQVGQGNEANPDIFDKNVRADKFKGGFNWHETSEYTPFWSDVLENRDFNLFFQKYPKKVQEKRRIRELTDFMCVNSSLNELRYMKENYNDTGIKGVHFHIPKHTPFKITSKPNVIAPAEPNHFSYKINFVSCQRDSMPVSFEKCISIIKASCTHIDCDSILKEREKPQECTSNPYPKVMWVWDNCEEDKQKRVVFAQKAGKYVSWVHAETLEDAEKEIYTATWANAEDITPEPQDQITSLMNYLVEIGHDPVAVFDNEQMIRDIVPRILSEKCNCKTKNE